MKHLIALCLAVVGVTAGGCGVREMPRQELGGSPYRMQSLADELDQLYRVDLLPGYRSKSVVAQISSYDTTGGNNDGFSGLYSYLRKEGDDLVLADLQGPGVIQRIWTPTPTEDPVAFYFDGESVPRIQMKFIDLFSGDVFPFLHPVVGNEVGGYYCYLPIPFEKSLKIVYKGERLLFHQIQYRLYPEGHTAGSFRMDWSEEERERLEKVRAFWRAYGSELSGVVVPDSNEIRRVAKVLKMEPGQTVDLFNRGNGGRVVSIEVEPASVFSGDLDGILLQAYWDDERQPAIHSPVADFFGYAFGMPSMQSLLLGARDGVLYSYLPMPFDHHASLQLTYQERPDARQEPVEVKARISYTATPRDPTAEGRFYAVWRRAVNPEEGKPYVLLDAAGKGHHVGTILQAQGLQPGMTVFFEGDDAAVIDGALRLHGTGSEDYFNGGWYALLDRWDRGISLPIHGSLDYSLPMARTGGYRFYLSDKVSFEQSYLLTIEHGPEGNKVPVDYTSVAFYYGDTPPKEVMAPSSAGWTDHAPDTHVFFPQLLPVSIGWNTIVDFSNGQDLVVSSDREGMVRISLDDVPQGAYNLFVSYYQTPKGCVFSVWQRQRQISGWQATYAAADAYLEKQPVGRIEISRQVKTISIRTRSDGNQTAFRFNRVVLERVQE